MELGDDGEQPAVGACPLPAGPARSASADDSPGGGRGQQRGRGQD